jgi:signal transduction histidine kinase
LNKIIVRLLIFLLSITGISQNPKPPVDTLIKYHKIDAWDFRYIDEKKATYHLLEGLKLSHKIDHEIHIGYFYRKLVSQKGYEDCLDSARYYFKEGYNYFNTLKRHKIKDLALPAHLHSELAEAYHVNNQMDSAFSHYKKAGGLYEKANDSLGVLISYANLGNIYNNSGNYKEAISLYLKASKMADTTQFLYIKGEIFANISAIYNTMDKPRMGKEYAYKFLNTVLRDTEKEYWIKGYMSVAHEEIKDQKFHLAEEYLNNAKHLIDSFGYKSYYLHLNKHRASMLLKQNRPKEAKFLLKESEPLLNEFKYTPELSFSYKFLLAKSLYLTGETQQAKNLLEPLENKADSLQLRKEQAYINKYLNKVYLKSGNYKKAYEAKAKYHQINDSILSVKARLQFKEIETKYQTEKKELALAKSQAQLTKKELEVKKKNLMLYGGVAIMVALLIFGLLLHNQQKLKHERFKKEAELTTALAKIETQNKLEEQRLRISRDLHDNIGSQLTFIISSLDNLPFKYPKMQEGLSNKLDLISDFTRQTIFELRDTIWAMNKSKITMVDMEQRLTKLTNNAKNLHQDLDFEFNQNVIGDFAFNSIQGINFYRIIQEAVNNSIKHSKASRVKISIAEEGGNLIAEVEDDGIGFAYSENSDSNGLSNMKKRIADLNGNIKFQSVPNKGTQVILTIKKPENTSNAV